jgi:hypothetical protein
MFSEKQSTSSTWPVVLFNYNIPPWLTMKKHFIVLSLIILRPKFVKGENIDTYFKPLVEELKKLWQTGMHVRDVSKSHEKHHFMLRAILLWMIHDLPMYKVVLKLATKRYRRCPICSVHTICRNPTLAKCEDETHIPKVGDLESSGTLEPLELDSKGQNTSHWGVIYINGNFLKCRCRKWPCMSHLDICSPSYGQKKGRKSNWQCDSRPLKVKN